MPQFRDNFPVWPPRRLGNRIPTHLADAHGIALLEGMLALDPALRINSSTALKSPFFSNEMVTEFSNDKKQQNDGRISLRSHQQGSY